MRFAQILQLPRQMGPTAASIEGNESDTIQPIVELLFNLLWVALSIALVGCWLVTRSIRLEYPRRSSAQVQVMALAMLMLILLPAISLTDDLQACTTPAEAEHLMRNLQNQMDAPVHPVATIVADLTFQMAPTLQTAGYPAPPVEVTAPSENYLSVAGNRPPPCA
jgi:hypothetical protein